MLTPGFRPLKSGCYMVERARSGHDAASQPSEKPHTYLTVKLHLCPSYLLLNYGQLNEDWMTFSSLSRFLFPMLSRSYSARSFGAASSFVLTMLLTSCTTLIYIRRYLFTCYTWKTLLNHVFEDLRRTKAPNSSPSRY
jgi:hypothetical protein